MHVVLTQMHTIGADIDRNPDVIVDDERRATTSKDTH
jgi:hypothetical protein